ncbi:MAG: MBL fold metallo-hydrolase [Lachnospiraceae bacterium]|nr:MBL fold metallo-hydrolase [Lachnospiraceae bacterium]
MKVQFLGAAHEVTGSRTLLWANGKKILIDCGMEQGTDIYENVELPVSPGDIDCVLLTHAHIDHSGMLPALVADGFRGPIYATPATQRLCNIMLRDSAHIQEQEAEWRNRKAQRSGGKAYVPAYTANDVAATLPLFETLDYGREYELFDGVRVRLWDAGHLLGSASYEITVTEGEETRSILFSGDLGNVDRPLIRDPQLPEPTDYVVIESTYGTRLHGARSDYASQLAEVIQTTLDRGGNVVIPCFAVGRTQEMLFLLRELKEQKRIHGHGEFPVWVDSPLAVEATNIYSEDILAFCDDETRALLEQGINPIRFPGLSLSITSSDSKAINEDPTPKVILSASGMCEAGRIRHHLKHNLWRPESTVLFVGYQAEGTLGQVLLDGAEKIRLFGEEIQVKARIVRMEGVSGHADQKILLSWLSAMKERKPRKVFVNHGNDTVCDEFASLIETELSMRAEAPYSGDCYDLLTGQRVLEGSRARVEHAEKKKPTRATTVYDRLVAAGRRLLSVIEKNREGANKDLAKFADQINELSNKWDR